jgi:hypothetical protein
MLKKHNRDKTSILHISRTRIEIGPQCHSKSDASATKLRDERSQCRVASGDPQTALDSRRKSCHLDEDTVEDVYIAFFPNQPPHQHNEHVEPPPIRLLNPFPGSDPPIDEGSIRV